MTKCKWSLNKNEHMTGLLYIDANCKEQPRTFYITKETKEKLDKCRYCGREVEWEGIK